MMADALGNPLAFSLSGANEADITHAPPLVDSLLEVQAVIADKGYDADTFIDAIEALGAEAIIPPRSNRRRQRSFDKHRYRARHLIENLFARLKQFRRLATR